MSSLQTIRRATVAESVREQIISLLEKRAYRPGDALPSERELMTQLGIGRSSLREGFAGLVALGVLTVGAGKGYRVRSLSASAPVLPPALEAAQVAELFETRRVLETGIVELACLRATEADFRALEGCLTSIRTAQQSRRSTAPSAARFHALLARAAHNGLLEKQLQGIRDLMVRVGATTERGAGSPFAGEQWESHKILLDVLRTRDPDAMRAAMHAHLDRFAAEAGVEPLRGTP